MIGDRTPLHDVAWTVATSVLCGPGERAQAKTGALAWLAEASTDVRRDAGELVVRLAVVARRLAGPGAMSVTVDGGIDSDGSAGLAGAAAAAAVFVAVPAAPRGVAPDITVATRAWVAASHGWDGCGLAVFAAGAVAWAVDALHQAAAVHDGRRLAAVGAP